MRRETASTVRPRTITGRIPGGCELNLSVPYPGEVTDDNVSNLILSFPGQMAAVVLAYLISASTVPWVMAAPGSTARPVMTPSLWAVTGFSIFIASRTTTRSPAATS